MAMPAVPNKNTQIRHYPLAGGQTWVQGAIISLAAGQISKMTGADPTPFLGFAACDAPVAPVDIYAGSSPVFCAYDGSTFWLEGTRAPLATDEGVKYGVVLAADGRATVDLTDVVNTRFLVERVDLVRNLYEVSVLAANRILQP